MTNPQEQARAAFQIRRHFGNDKLIQIVGLKIVQIPERVGGGYALIGDVAERLVAALQAMASQSQNPENDKQSSFPTTDDKQEPAQAVDICYMCGGRRCNECGHTGKPFNPFFDGFDLEDEKK